MAHWLRINGPGSSLGSECLTNGPRCAWKQETDRVNNFLLHRTHLRVLLALTALALIYLSLYPFNFNWGIHASGLHWHAPAFDSDWVDVCANFVGYLPLGFLAMAAWDLQGVASVALITLSGIVFSAGVELLQMYLPVRDSNLRDLTCNALGTAAGGFAAWRARESLSRLRILWPPPGGLALALLWTVWQMYPFFPILRRPTLHRLVAQFPQWEFQRIEFTDLILAAILLYAFLERSEGARGFTTALVSALVIFTLFVQALVFGMSYSNARMGAATIGLVVAVLLWRPNRGYWMSLSLGAFCWVVFREMQPFSWIPSSPWGSMEHNLYVRTLAGKVFFWASVVVGFHRGSLSRAHVGSPVELSVEGRGQVSET